MSQGEEEAPTEAKRRRTMKADEGDDLEAAGLEWRRTLRKDWAKGEIDAGRVLSYARKSAAAGAVNMGKMAGHAGNTAKHSHRDLVRAIGWPSSAPEIEWLDVGDISVPFVCPIDMMERLLEAGEADEGKRRHIMGAPGDVEKYWSGLRAVGNPVFTALSSNIDPKLDLALGLHGDGAPTHKTEGLFTINWNSLHGEGSTEHTRHVCAVLKKSDVSDGSLAAVWDRLAWSMNCLAAGRIAERDWRGKRHPKAGRKLLSGRKAFLIQMRGDWEFYTQVLKFPAPNSEPNNCWICSALLLLTISIGPLTFPR